MTPAARDNTIKHFTNNPEVTVFLISLKAGGTSLGCRLVAGTATQADFFDFFPPFSLSFASYRCRTQSSRGLEGSAA